MRWTHQMYCSTSPSHRQQHKYSVKTLPWRSCIVTFPYVWFDLISLFQIEGFDVKRVDEYHLTGITLDMFVRWEHRPPSSTDGRGENRNEARGEGRPKPEQKKPDDTHYSEGLVSLSTTHHIIKEQFRSPLIQVSKPTFMDGCVCINELSPCIWPSSVTFPQRPA